MKLSSLLPLAWSLLTTASPLQPPTDDISPRANYDGYHVYSITPSSAREAQDLAKRFERHHTQPVRDTLSVAIPPEEVEEFHSLNLKARLVKDDLGAYIRSTDGEASPLRKRGGGGDGELPDLNWFDSYHAYEDHLRFWDGLVEAFEGNVRKFEIGRSWENRTIWAFRLFGDEKEGSEGKKKGGKKGGKGEGEGESEKPVILWHATVHAREWISTMVIEYLAYQLIDGYKAGDTNATAFLDHYDFYLIPFHNPDGFVYTQTTDRLWRKNRQPRPTLNTTCLGTDGNRNWVFEWDAEPPEGGSTPDPCGQTYRGISPGDTPENAAVDSLSAALASRSGPGIRSFIDFHSYSQLILTPWGFSCDPLPETLPRMVEVANGTARAIEAASERGSEYLAGPGCEILYFSTGNSRDHHYAVRGAEHSWTLELSPSAEEEQVGFVLPPGEIWPVVREQWAGQIWLLNEVWEG